MKYQTGGFPQSGSLFIQIDNKQPELTGSAFKGKPIPYTREPIIESLGQDESIRQGILQAIKESTYGKNN